MRNFYCEATDVNQSYLEQMGYSFRYTLPQVGVTYFITNHPSKQIGYTNSLDPRITMADMYDTGWNYLSTQDLIHDLNSIISDKPKMLDIHEPYITHLEAKVGAELISTLSDDDAYSVCVETKIGDLRNQIQYSITQQIDEAILQTLPTKLLQNFQKQITTELLNRSNEG